MSTPHGPAAMPRPGLRHAVQELGMLIRGDSLTHRFLRARLAILAVATLVVDAVATVAMYLLEHDKQASGFHDFGGTLFWVSGQLTTVSSQLPNPVTGAGQALDILLEIWSITVVAALAASFTSFLHSRHIERLAVGQRPQRSE